MMDKMVIRFKDKSLIKGRPVDFSPKKTMFSFRLLNGEVVKVDIEKLKAVFMVKTFEGNKNYNYTYKDFLPWGGNKVKVEFFDGEVIIGYVPHHINNERGFFVTPADLGGNNKQVFVVTSAIRDIIYL